MPEVKKFTIQEAHKSFASGIFNRVWDLLEKKDRNSEEDDLMINAAHASLYHWRMIGEPIHFQRGEWMVAHVYTVLSMKESALHHSRICLELTKENNIEDFDLGFAYEGYARALALNGDEDQSRLYFFQARDSAEQIKEKGDRDYFLQVLNDGPWFGVAQD